ncbi:MAG: HD domain-containing protein [Parcubacteria group bacterium]|jgi:putative hydrolase of HD superfamily
MKINDKNTNPVHLVLGMEDQIDPILFIYLQVNHLKQILRQGWPQKGRDVPVDKCESVADHVYGMCMLALLIISKHSLNLELLKVFIMILVHDVVEVYAGDTRPGEMSKEEKQKRERAAIYKIFGDSPWLKFCITYWEEYEEQKTAEAQFVKELDFSERGIQSFIYGKQHNRDLSVFLSGAESKLKNPVLLRIIDDLRRCQ